MDNSLRVRVSSVGSTSRHFTMRDLVEEIIVAGVCPITKDWEFLVAGNRSSITKDRNNNIIFQKGQVDRSQ
jgi:hypothetical protein